jgi:hypothetical protein
VLVRLEGVDYGRSPTTLVSIHKGHAVVSKMIGSYKRAMKKTVEEVEDKMPVVGKVTCDAWLKFDG